MSGGDFSDPRLAAFALDHATIGILRIGEDGRVLDANARACEKLGYTREELTSLHVFDINPMLTRENWAEHSRRFVGQPEPVRFEATHRRKSGAIFPVEVTVSCLQVDGRTFFVACTRELSEQKLVEAEREKLQTRLAHTQRLESLGRLAGGVAHDFNNMLSVIVLGAEQLLETLPSNAAQRAEAEEIRHAAMRSGELTRQLLAFARQQAIAPRTLDLGAEIAERVKMLRRVIGENIDLRLAPAVELWPISMDPIQLEQVITNLVLNARDAIDGQGVVTIGVSNHTVSELAPGRHGLPHGEHVLLVVQDTGHGIEEDVLSRVFEPFYTTKQLGRGTGLGLATVFGIVAQNGGVVRVESQLGVGTTFFVYLPRAHDTVTHDVALPPTQLAPRGDETILLVEDEPQVLRLTQGVLELLGYRVLAAATPGEALRIAEQHGDAIQLLLTDVVMPEMSGPQLADRLRERWPGLAVVLTSGHAAENALELSPLTPFLQKPVTRHALAQTVRRALEQGASGAPLARELGRSRRALT